MPAKQSKPKRMQSALTDAASTVPEKVPEQQHENDSVRLFFVIFNILFTGL
jgi:hypothetical protein